MAKKTFEYPVNGSDGIAKADSNYGITMIGTMYVLTQYRRIIVYVLSLWLFGPSTVRSLVTVLPKLWQ